MSPVDESLKFVAAVPTDAAAPLCSYCPNPERGKELREEIKFVMSKANEEKRRRMEPDAEYIQHVQKNQIKPFMRRMVFEWNLEVHSQFL